MRRVRAILRFGWIYFLWVTGALGRAKRRLGASGAVVVLTLHRVLDDAEFAASSSLPGILLRERTFERLLDRLCREYEIVDLGRGVPDWSTSSANPRVAITFDDGWFDNYRFAQPLADRHGVTMAIFVCPGLDGQQFPFWPERVVKLLRRNSCDPAIGELTGGRPTTGEGIERTIENLKQMDPAERDKLLGQLMLTPNCCPSFDEEPTNRTMTRYEIRELREKGVRFGSHTQHHVILTQAPPETIALELTQSRCEIEQALEQPCEMFAYPNGNYDETTLRLVRESGYKLAFTTRRGAWTHDADPLQIPRVNLSENHLLGPTGRFSTPMFEYSVFYRGAVQQ